MILDLILDTRDLSGPSRQSKMTDILVGGLIKVTVYHGGDARPASKERIEAAESRENLYIIKKGQGFR